MPHLFNSTHFLGIAVIGNFHDTELLKIESFGNEYNFNQRYIPFCLRYIPAWSQAIHTCVVGEQYKDFYSLKVALHTFVGTLTKTHESPCTPLPSPIYFSPSLFIQLVTMPLVHVACSTAPSFALDELHFLDEQFRHTFTECQAIDTTDSFWLQAQ